MATEMAITSQLDLTSFKAMGAAKSRRVTVNPENVSSFTSSASTTDVFFTLPSGRFTMINGQNSYLAFDVTCAVGFTSANALTTGATNAYIANGSASSFIRTLEVIAQSQSIELLDKYDVWAALVEDAQGYARTNTINAVVNGGPTWTNAATSGSTAGLISATRIKQGYDLFGAGAPTFVTGVLQPSTKTIRVAIPIYSSSIGVLQQQYLPAADGLRLRLSFQPSDIPLIVRSQLAVATAAATCQVTYSVSNMALQMDYLDINPEVYSQLVAESGGVLRQHGSAVSCFGSTIPAGTTFTSLLIPARYSSVKNFLTCFRNAVSTTSQQANCAGDRIYPLLNDYVYRTDGKNMPSVNVRCGNSSGVCLAGESMMEVIKCFHSLHSAQFDVVFGLAEYSQSYLALSAGVNTSPAFVAGTAGAWKTQVAGDFGYITGSYFIGLEFEQDQAGKAVISGLDTNSSNTYLDLNITYSGGLVPSVSTLFCR